MIEKPESNVIDFQLFLAKKHKKACMQYMHSDGKLPVLTGKITTAILESDERFFDN